MKKNLIIGIIIIIIAIAGAVYFSTKKEAIVPTIIPPGTTELTLRENVEKYLRANISTLSPVKAVLGGTWYVLSVTVDLPKSSGTVAYEDGHIQETKNFTFTADAKGEVTSLVIIK